MGWSQFWHWFLHTPGPDLLAWAVSACVPAQSSRDRGKQSRPSPSVSRTTSKLRQGAPMGGKERWGQLRGQLCPTALGP